MGYGKGVYDPISDHRPYTKRKSIFKRCDFLVSYAVLLYGKWLFYQELFSYKYRKEIDQKFTDSVCSCMPDIDHMLYGTGMAAAVYCESGTYKRKTAGDDHGDQQYLHDPEGNSFRLACLVRGLPVRRKNPLRTGDE